MKPVSDRVSVWASLGYAVTIGDWTDMIDGGLTYGLGVHYALNENMGMGIGMVNHDWETELLGMTFVDTVHLTTDNEALYGYQYPSSHPLIKGHFPNNPVMMGVCQWQMLEDAMAHYFSKFRVQLKYEIPLSEIVFDFYDRLKTVSKGYASFDYSPIGMRPSKLVKVDILLNTNPVDALSALIHSENAYAIGKKMCERLRELIPRQQFDIPVQAAIGAKIISRETIKALRKDVTAKCYGGDITRKRKLLEKQKKGKKKMRQVGSVEIPQQAFMAVLKLND